MDNKEVLQKYVSDQIALESHIYQAIDKQQKLAENDAEAKQKFAQFTGTLQGHIGALKSALGSLGGNPAGPIKEAGAAVLGVGAGLIDKMRAEELSKDLRDDYTALNLSVISYMMLNATADALGNRQVADLAKRFAKDNADFVMWINKNIARFVVKDLQDSGASINPAAQNASQGISGDVWTQ